MNKISTLEIRTGGGGRNSSIELFRLLATFFVLVVHLNGWMAGGLADFGDQNIGLDHKIGQLIIQSLTVVAVNCFLIISGWFGLKLKFSSVWKIWVLLFSIYVPFYLFDVFTGGNTFSIVTLLNQTIALSCESYFIQNYLMLMFLSPMLNSFIENNRDKVTVYAISLFVIEVTMESIFRNECLFIKDGYSLIHFVTIYMLARAAFINKEKIICIDKRLWIVGYFICAAVIIALSFTEYKHTWSYSNPIVVLESFMLFFPFLYKDFSNKFINRIAAGAFAVYVIQVTNPVCRGLFKLDQYALSTLPYHAYLPIMLVFACFFFVICILYYEVSQRLLSPILNPLCRFFENKIKLIVK